MSARDLQRLGLRGLARDLSAGAWPTSQLHDLRSLRLGGCPSTRGEGPVQERANRTTSRINPGLSVFWRQRREQCANPAGEKPPAAGFFDQPVEIEPEDASDVLLVALMVRC